MGIAIPQFITPSKASGAQVIDGSLRFTENSSDFKYLTRTLGSGNRRTFTFSYWYRADTTQTGKRYISTGYNTNGAYGFYIGDNSERITFNDTGTGSANYNVRPTRKIRDNGWYHYVFNLDTTQATEADRVRIYVNGVRQTDFSTNTLPSQNANGGMNTSGRTLTLGAWELNDNIADGLQGQLAQFYYIDGQSLDASYFGFTDPLTNTWKPKKYTGSFTSTRSEDATLNTSFATSPPTDSTGTTTLTTQNISTQTASTNDFGVTTSTVFSGASQYSRVTTNLTIDISEPFTIDFIAKFNQTGSSSYFCQYGSGSAIIQTDNPAANTTCLLWGATTFSMSYGWHSVRVQWDGSRSKLWVDGTLTLNITNSPGGSDGALAIGAHPTQDIRTFNGEFGPFRFTPAALGAPKSGGLDASDFTDSTAGFDNPNSFYLPFDGKTPIGKDQSGKGNDFTPVNFGGSVELDSPLVTGARPILNTTQGGTQAGVGVFGSKQNVGYAVTVYNDGGGNKYYIDGVKQDTVTGLIRGATYTFDTSDSTVSSHPFRFSATSNGSHGGGSEYTTGVAAITGAATTITVPHDAPNTLYYYCTSHSGMGADITGITTNEKLADQYASSCILALPMLSSKDSSNELNITSANKSVTNNNVTTTPISHFYGSSSLFDSSSDYYRLGSSPFDYGSGDFTMEFWCYLTGAYTTARHIISAWQDGGNQTFYVGSGGANGYWASFGVKIGGTQYEVNGDVNKGRIPQDNWVHIAAVRDGTNLKLFVNGSLVGTTACGSGSMISLPTYVYIGKHYSASGYEWVGNLSDLRIYKGIAKYTEAFVPASTNPDILLDTPSGVAGGSKLTKISDGAVSFDGSGDYLTLADSTDFDFGTGDYTAEAFVYAKSHADMYVINQSTDHGGAAPWWGLNVWSNGSSFTIRAGRTDGSGNAKHEVTFPWAINKWYHFAVSRSSGTSRLYFDGVLLDTKSDTDDIDGNGTLYVGAYNDGSLNWNGFISNVRIVKGTGVYTEPRITPPTAPLTNVTNTKLLCCQSNTSATAAAVTPGSITANGDAAAINFNPFINDINTVRGQESDYSTFNPLLNRGNNTLTNGKTFVTGGSNWNTTLCTGVIESGKWFVELTHRGRQSASDNDIQFGLFGLNNPEDGYPLASTKDLAAQSTGYVIVDAQAQWYNNGSSTSYGTTWSTPGDVVGLRYNADTGKLGFIINGVDQGDISSTLSTSQRWVVGISLRGGGAKAEINFGQKPFKFPPPDGFQLLNAANTRPVKVISRPDQYVGVTTYSGNSSSSNFVTDLNFNSKPDFVWIKARSGSSSPGSQNHYLVDSVRGANGSVTKKLYSNSNGEENAGQNDANNGVRFVLNGFELTSSNDGTNANNAYVAWAWKAGGNKNTFNVDDVGYASAAAAGLSCTADLVGASVGTKQGFSIIRYQATSGETVAHGLSEQPLFMMIKNMDSANDWMVYHKNGNGSGGDMSSSQVLNLNNADATSSSGSNTFITGKSATTFTVGSSSIVQNGSDDMIAYIWHDVPGLQKFGTYTSSTVADGPYVELGFKPAVVLVKNTGTNANNTLTGWAIYDNERPVTYNPNHSPMFANTTGSEGQRGDASGTAGTTMYIDFLSNGFKIKATSAEVNTNTGADVYIYAAWAAAPSIDLYGGGANAR